MITTSLRRRPGAQGQGELSLAHRFVRDEDSAPERIHDLVRQFRGQSITPVQHTAEMLLRNTDVLGDSCLPDAGPDHSVGDGLPNLLTQ
jgi:hypothetical protein